MRIALSAQAADSLLQRAPNGSAPATYGNRLARGQSARADALGCDASQSNTRRHPGALDMPTSATRRSQPVAV